MCPQPPFRRSVTRRVASRPANSVHVPRHPVRAAPNRRAGRSASRRADQLAVDHQRNLEQVGLAATRRRKLMYRRSIRQVGPVKIPSASSPPANELTNPRPSNLPPPSDPAESPAPGGAEGRPLDPPAVAVGVALEVGDDEVRAGGRRRRRQVDTGNRPEGSISGASRWSMAADSSGPGWAGIGSADATHWIVARRSGICKGAPASLATDGEPDGTWTRPAARSRAGPWPDLGLGGVSAELHPGVAPIAHAPARGQRVKPSAGWTCAPVPGRAWPGRRVVRAGPADRCPPRGRG